MLYVPTFTLWQHSSSCFLFLSPFLSAFCLTRFLSLASLQTVKHRRINTHGSTKHHLIAALFPPSLTKTPHSNFLDIIVVFLFFLYFFSLLCSSSSSSLLYMEIHSSSSCIQPHAHLPTHKHNLHPLPLANIS